MQVFKCLSDIPLFSGLNSDQLDAVCKIAVEKSLAKNDVIFSEGDPGNGFYVVTEGMVKIFKVSFEGKEQILHIFGPPEPFGEVPVFTGKPFPANAQTLAPSRLLFFPRTEFVTLISTNPSLALNMLAVLSMRLRQLAAQIENLSLKEVPGRLAGYLIYLQEDQGDGDNVTLNFSKGQLASLLGTIPETLSRILTKMIGKGLIEVRGRHIHITNRQALESLAGYEADLD